MIPPDRFVAQSHRRDAWLAARSAGVTATEVRDAATEAGFRDLVASLGTVHDGNGYTEFGSWAEPLMLDYAHREHGILPSDWLIAADDPRWLATPDGLSLDHRWIAEAKTTGRDWKTPPVRYRRQVQWQLRVTGAERCLFLWQLRGEAEDGSFFLRWLEPKSVWIDRDEAMIADLERVAEKVWQAKREWADGGGL